MNTKIIKKESFLKAVKKELQNIKKYATSLEISKLINGIKRSGLHNYKDRCVYGLMTGNCDNDRGCELVEKCASIYKLHGEKLNSYLSYNDLLFLRFDKHRKRRNDIIYRSYVELFLIIDRRKLLDMISIIFNKESEDIKI